MEVSNTVELDNSSQSNNHNLNKMGTMPVGKLLFSMSLPAMFSMLIQALYNIVDSIFVGRISDTALASVTLIFPIQMLIISVGVGTGIGLNSLISRRLGEENFREANLAASHGVILSFVNWVIFACFGFFFTEKFVMSYSENPHVAADSIAFCKIVTIFSLFLFIQFSAEKILQATGNMILPMISNLIGAIINIILNPILIFGLLGAPKLGVPGSAYATVIGQSIAMCIALFFLFVKKHALHVTFKNFKFSFNTIGNIYAVGLPAIVMQAIGSVMIFGLNKILVSFSIAAVAVLGSYFRLQSFIFMPVFGLTQGAMPILGYNYGAKNLDRLKKTFKMSMITAIIIMGVGIIIFQLFPVLLLRMFNATPDMIHIGVPALRIISMSFIFAAISIICSTLFQATGYGTFSLIVSALRQLILILPLAYLLSRYFGLDSVWYAFPLAEFFCMIVSAVILKLLYQRKKEQFHLNI